MKRKIKKIYPHPSLSSVKTILLTKEKEKKSSVGEPLEKCWLLSSVSGTYTRPKKPQKEGSERDPGERLGMQWWEQVVIDLSGVRKDAAETEEEYGGE